MTDVEIRPVRFGAPIAQQMVALAQEDITQRYGSADANPIEPVQFDPPEGIFLVAWHDGQPIGCAGWRIVGEPGDVMEDVAEIKRMYVVPSARNTGVASALLKALEDTARENGVRRMILETGLAQPEAMALYTKRGYEKIPNYGYYKDEPDCVSFGRDL